MLTTVATLVLLGTASGAVIDSHIQDVEFEDTSSSTSYMANCTYANCVSFCESIGYITGNCIGNSCICVLPREEQNKHVEFEDTSSSTSYMANCTYANCVSFCESIGYITGNCIGNSCICVLPREEQNKNVEFEDTSSSTSYMANCTYVNCVSFCQSIGYLTGNCVGNSCVCVWPRGEHDKHNIVRASITLNSCDQTKCNQICQLLGFTKGTCVGDTCECTRSEERTEQSVKSCNFRQCEQLCRRLGFAGGACVGDRCKCDIILQIQAEIEPVSHRVKALKDCQPLECDRGCRKIGFRGGACVNGHCKCDIVQKLEELTEPASHRSARDCIHSRCHGVCRRMHFNNGVCVGDRCKCDALFPIEGAVIPTPLDGHKCTPRECKDFCGSVGFSGSSCLGNKCKCEILLKREDNDIPPMD